MRATLTVEYPVPAEMVARVEAESREAYVAANGSDEGFKGAALSAFYDDNEVSAAMRGGSGRAASELNNTARKIGLTQPLIDIHYGIGGRNLHFWYQRSFS